MKIEEVVSEYDKTYDKGLFNHAVRAWFYLQRGLQVMNEFKYLVAGILAFYYTLELHSIPLLLIIFFVSSRLFRQNTNFPSKIPTPTKISTTSANAPYAIVSAPRPSDSFDMIV